MYMNHFIFIAFTVITAWKYIQPLMILCQRTWSTSSNTREGRHKQKFKSSNSTVFFSTKECSQ